MQSKFGLSLAGICKPRHAAHNDCRENFATPAANDRESNNNHPTDNPVAQTMQNGVTASGQDTENVSKASSAKQRCEERMKKIDIEFETKMRMEQARFERRKLELETQTKKLEIKHHLLEDERELERKVKRTALEKEDVRSQSTSAQENSPFIGTRRREMSQTETVGLTTV